MRLPVLRSRPPSPFGSSHHAVAIALALAGGCAPAPALREGRTSPPLPSAPVPCSAPPTPTAPVVQDAGAIAHRIFVDAEERSLPVRGADGRGYVIYAFLPESYATHPERRYPVVYVCDGYWDGPLIKAIYGNLVYDKTAPEFILIGFGYPGEHADYNRLRRWDYTPVVDPPSNGGTPDTGHAGEFLDVVERAIIPLVEHEYRADPAYRVLAGSSLGGLFTLYALFTKPALFQAYVAPSPAVLFAGDWLFGYEAAFAKTAGARDLRARVFVSGADQENPSFFAAIQRFDAQVRAHAYPALQYQYRIVDGEHHAGTKGESYSRGLRFALAPLLPGGK